MHNKNIVIFFLNHRLIVTMNTPKYDARIIQSLIDTSPNIAFAKDINHRFIAVNEKYVKSVSMESAHSIVGRHETDMPWSSTESLEYINSDIRVIDSRQPLINHVETQSISQGKSYSILVNKHCVINDKNKVIGVAGNYRVISDNQRRLLSIQDVHNNLKRIFSLDFKKINIVIENKDVKLTRQETLCALLTIIGYTADNISAELMLSRRTVEAHINNIKLKTAVTKKSEMVRHLLHSSLIENISLMY